MKQSLYRNRCCEVIKIEFLQSIERKRLDLAIDELFDSASDHCDASHRKEQSSSERYIRKMYIYRY